MNLLLDSTDPTVAGVTWVLTFLLSTYIEGEKYANLRKALPVIAVLIAVFLRVVFALTMGNPLDWMLLARAFGSGAVAVLTHSQFREMVKLLVGSTVKPENPNS